MPIPKKNKITCLNDWRPIALTPIFSKCFEKLIRDYICSVLPASLDPLQFAYRSNRSTDDAIAFTLHTALSHLENKNAYVRMLFVDYSSAFNTIVPATLVAKLQTLGLNRSLCSWILDFLTGRSQVVRMGNNTSSPLTLNTSAPRGCVLSPLLYSLYTHDCADTNSSNVIVKFADDTTVIGLITDNDETAYRAEVSTLTKWCQENHLSLNIDKTKELVVDFRRQSREHTPITIDKTPVERVNSFKFLGVHITEDLTWSAHTDAVLKKSHQRLFFLRRLRKFGMSPSILRSFYTCTVESILTGCITAWFGNSTAGNRKALQRVVRTARHIVGGELPSLQDIYTRRCIRKARRITNNSSHPSHRLFSLLPSGRRLRSIRSRTSRLRDSFFPQAIRPMNSQNYNPKSNLQKQHFTEQQATQLSSLKEEYDLLSHSKAEFILHRTRQKYYFESERPSHLLALRLKECESKAYISAIKSSDDQVTTNPVAINDIFKGFYTNLYKAETDFDEPICKQYLDKLELTWISQMDKESLEAPLSLEELHVSLKSLQKGKSPGLDGLPPELYLEIWDLVGILMLNSFNFAIEHGAFHRDQKTSLISLLLKKGKDPLDCSSYRPISLIPCDLKIYAKVFASRLEKVIHSLIKEDQTGFIKGRNASDNMRRLLHILDFADSHPTPCAVFSLDAEKAFDRLVWNYMWAVLQCFSFGEHFVSMIKTLYHSPAASVITGNIISPSFPLQRGTRQGCPLSPLLFCLSLEPLAQAIRKSEVSIKIHDHDHCISLYADDIILYIDHFDVSVSSVIKEFDNFSSLSGYKINWSKSALMPINNVKVNFSIPSFIPIKESFIYLGITIYKNIHKIARDNFNNILVKVKNDIQRWKNLKVSLQGRISTVKMNLLPRFNFFSLCYHFLPLQVTLRRSTP